MAKRNFSLMLALRYLNPLRALFSAITIISLLGVALGVMVMVVVLSVMAGFEKEVKERILGFAPHVRIQMWGENSKNSYASIRDWQGLNDKVTKVKGVKSAYGLIEGYVIVETEGSKKPINFRAIDTEDESQITDLDDLLDQKNYPGGRADMGKDEVVVISSLLAKELRLGIGDMLRLHSAKNLEEIGSAYELAAKDLICVTYAKELNQVKQDIKTKFSSENQEEVIPMVEMEKMYASLQEIHQKQIRYEEIGILYECLSLMEEGERAENSKSYRFKKGIKEKLLITLQELWDLDKDAIDSESLKGLREIVLPKELEVIGVYLGSRHIVGPDLFIPLETGRELTDIEVGVHATALRLEDPYQIHKVEEGLARLLGEKWDIISWTRSYKEQFRLIKMERAMMSFALSFIMIISAFSITAVMYTVTIQKQQEIGVIKALGAVPSQVAWVFIWQGLIVGILGGGLGVGLGVLIVHFRKPIQIALDSIGLNPFPASFHGMDVIPAQINQGEVGLVFIGAVFLCCFAAFVPAVFAARKDAAKSLRSI